MTQAQAFNEFAAQAFYADSPSFQGRQRTIQEGWVCTQSILETTSSSAYWLYGNSGPWTLFLDLRSYQGPGTITPPPDVAFGQYARVIATSPANWVKTDTGPGWRNWSYAAGMVNTDGSIDPTRQPNFLPGIYDSLRWYSYDYPELLPPGVPLTVTFQVQLGCPDVNDPRFVNWPGSIARRTQLY